MTKKAFLKAYRDEIDSIIRDRLNDPNYKLSDRERWLWVLNEEQLYWWAKREGVKV